MLSINCHWTLNYQYTCWVVVDYVQVSKKISKKLIKKKLNNGERTKEEDTPVIGDDDYCNTD